MYAMDDPNLSEVPTEPRRPPQLGWGWRWQRLFWQGRIGSAFWTVASLFSLIVNIVLIVMLVVMGQKLFSLKRLVSEQLIGGLFQNFVLMDQGQIQTIVQVSDQIPVQFDLPVATTTTVKLTKNTRIRGASVNLSTGGLTISNAPTTILLPAGTELPIALSIVVPVDLPLLPNTALQAALSVWNIPFSARKTVKYFASTIEGHQSSLKIQVTDDKDIHDHSNYK
jgi:hypothetical protein